MSLTLKIISPDKTEFEGQVDSVIIPTLMGKIGILKNHANMVTAIGVGPLIISGDLKLEEEILIEDGFAKIENNTVVVLVGQILKTSDLRLEEEQKELEELLKIIPNTDVGFKIKNKKINSCREKINFLNK